MQGEQPQLDAARIIGLLADADRRRVIAALQLGATSLDEVVGATGLATPAAARALASVASAGLVIQGERGLELVEAAFVTAARAALARERAHEHDAEPREIRKVLDAFVRDGVITQFPTSRQKRLLVLDWVVQDFAPGERYTERDVNEILRRRHADVAALRRYLVDEDLLSREAGEYWRTGGTVDVDES